MVRRGSWAGGPCGRARPMFIFAGAEVRFLLAIQRCAFGACRPPDRRLGRPRDRRRKSLAHLSRIAGKDVSPGSIRLKGALGALSAPSAAPRGARSANAAG
jgi:hypothetical protein